MVKIDPRSHALSRHLHTSSSKRASRPTSNWSSTHTHTHSLTHALPRRCEIPSALGITAEELNRRLFKKGAAILKGSDCDMTRAGAASTLLRHFRFSFGPLAPESFDGDVEIMRAALAGE